MLDKKYVEQYETMFMVQYDTCHRLNLMKLRNVAKLFEHFLHTDALSSGVLRAIMMNEDDTNSYKRIFVNQFVL